MRFYFDMDGTIVDLYGVPKWKEKLDASDPSPYVEAKPLINLSLFARYIHQLQAKGHEVGIISWCSKNSTPQYDIEVIRAKHSWLREHLPSVTFNSIVITEYGAEKGESVNCGPGDFLFDDEPTNRMNWHYLHNGRSFDVNNILPTLKDFIKVF